jgi:hypothetical protein
MYINELYSKYKIIVDHELLNDMSLTEAEKECGYITRVYELMSIGLYDYVNDKLRTICKEQIKIE